MEDELVALVWWQSLNWVERVTYMTGSSLHTKDLTIEQIVKMYEKHLNNDKETITISDKSLLPEHITQVNDPVFKGCGNHNIMELETMVQQYKELVYQLRLRNQELDKILRLDYNIFIVE